jgi:hypothetical protein
MSLADVVLPRMREENEKLRADIERLQAESNISDALLADAKAEIERLRTERDELLAACQRSMQPMDDHMSGQEVAVEVKIRMDMMRAAINRALEGK